MLWDKPSIVMYLASRTLHVYGLSGGNTPTLEFTASAVQAAEVIDKAAFYTLLTDFLSPLHLHKKRILVVLAPQLVFSNELPIKGTVERGKMKDDFFANVPFDTDTMVKKEVLQKDKVTLYATNGDFCRIMMDVGHQLGMQIVAIVPLMIFGEREVEGALKKPVVGRILKQHNLWQATNFLDALSNVRRARFYLSYADEVDAEHPINRTREYLLLAVSLLLLGGSILFALVQYDVVRIPTRTPAQRTKIDVSAMPTIVPTALLEEARTALEVRALKVQIVGNGKSALTELREGLVNLGFEEIFEELVTQKAEELTRVRFAVRVSESLRDEVIATLEEMGAEIQVEEEVPESELDVVVVLGVLP